MPTFPSSSAASPTTVATLVARGISHDRGGRAVLSDVSCTVGPETCLGVVGPNGVGKSTLLQILGGRGLELPDRRRRHAAIRPTATVGYLAQEHERRRRRGVGPRQSVGATDRGGRGRGGPGRQRRPGSAVGGPREAECPLRGGARTVHESLSAWRLRRADRRRRSPIWGLGAEVAERQDKATLSGGQEAKVALAAVELSRFSVTLLDEPTNDLDFEGLGPAGGRWMQLGGGVGMVIVSHDRAFLEQHGDRPCSSSTSTSTERAGSSAADGPDTRPSGRPARGRHADEAYAVYERTQSGN